MKAHEGNIIICNGRIDVAVSRNGMEMIRAASRCAVDLLTYYRGRLTAIDTLPISDVQQQMLDLLNAKPVVQNAGEMVDQMFALLEALERKIG